MNRNQVYTHNTQPTEWEFKWHQTATARSQQFDIWMHGKMIYIHVWRVYLLRFLHLPSVFCVWHCFFFLVFFFISIWPGLGFWIWFTSCSSMSCKLQQFKKIITLLGTTVFYLILFCFLSLPKFWIGYNAKRHCVYTIRH